MKIWNDDSFPRPMTVIYYTRKHERTLNGGGGQASCRAAAMGPPQPRDFFRARKRRTFIMLPQPVLPSHQRRERFLLRS